MRVCSNCKVAKPFSEYSFVKARNNYLYRCKVCQRLYTKQWYEKNKGSIRDRTRKWIDVNREKVKAFNTIQKQTWREENREKDLEATLRYQEKNPEKVACWKIYNRGLRAGTIVRPDTCSRCGKGGRIEGHHHDYSKPLEVEWVCLDCHGSERHILKTTTKEES